MRKSLLGTAAAGLLAVAVATPASAAPPQDAVTGGGKHLGGTLTEGVSAHGTGTDARGNVTITAQGEGLFGHGKVTCLLVTGNRAIITWVSSSTREGGTTEGQIVVTEIVDNGNPNDGAPPDLIRNSFAGAIFEDPDNPGCFLPVLPPVPVEQGNYRVHDAP